MQSVSPPINPPSSASVKRVLRVMAPDGRRRTMGRFRVMAIIMSAATPSTAQRQPRSHCGKPTTLNPAVHSIMNQVRSIRMRRLWHPAGDWALGPAACRARRDRRVLYALLATIVFAYVQGTAAQAQATRTYVSGQGKDGNPCTVTQPCQTLQTALAQTAAGGTIYVLSSANYGNLTIN